MDRKDFVKQLEIAQSYVLSDEIFNLIKKEIEVYGRLKESTVVLEELAELQQEVTKIMREENWGESFDDHDHYSLLEEMADVQLAIYILMGLYDVTSKDLSKAVNVKFERAKRRIGK